MSQLPTITIVGAAGQVGRLVTADALARGYRVRALVHRRPLPIHHRDLTGVPGDVYDPDSVAAAIKGSGAVISCLSSWGAPHKDVLGSAMQAIIPAMAGEKLARLISLTGADARDQTDRPGLVNRLSHAALGVVASGVLADGERHLALLRASSLSWTVIRSPVMLPGAATGTYHLSLELGSPLATIRRADVAAAMLDQLNADDFLGKAPVIHRGLG